jgi:hypothetical protein
MGVPFAVENKTVFQAIDTNADQAAAHALIARIKNWSTTLDFIIGGVAVAHERRRAGFGKLHLVRLSTREMTNITRQYNFYIRTVALPRNFSQPLAV